MTYKRKTKLQGVREGQASRQHLGPQALPHLCSPQLHPSLSGSRGTSAEDACGQQPGDCFAQKWLSSAQGPQSFLDSPINPNS